MEDKAPGTCGWCGKETPRYKNGNPKKYCEGWCKNLAALARAEARCKAIKEANPEAVSARLLGNERRLMLRTAVNEMTKDIKAQWDDEPGRRSVASLRFWVDSTGTQYDYLLTVRRSTPDSANS